MGVRAIVGGSGGSGGQPGPQGNPGKDGVDGKSAYQLAVDDGFVGTVAQWLSSLKGDNGRSAYQVALDNGFTGTQEEWLISLVGQDGKDGKSFTIKGHIATYADLPTAVVVDGDAYVVHADRSLYIYANGFPAQGLGIEFEGVKGDKGDEGLSAFDIWKLDGHPNGTIPEYEASLKGDKGDDGVSDLNKVNLALGQEVNVSTHLSPSNGGSADFIVSVKDGTNQTKQFSIQSNGDDGAEVISTMNIRVPTPSKDGHSTPKKYVDDAVNGAIQSFSSSMNILTINADNDAAIPSNIDLDINTYDGIVINNKGSNNTLGKNITITCNDLDNNTQSKIIYIALTNAMTNPNGILINIGNAVSLLVGGGLAALSSVTAPTTGKLLFTRFDDKVRVCFI